MDPYAHAVREAERSRDLNDRVIALVGIHHPDPHRILDVGCGPGVITSQLVAHFPGAHVIAADASPAMLERVGDGVETRLVELPDGLDDLEPVDVIWASQVLHHVHDLAAALANLRDVLAPGGVLAVLEQPHAHGIDVAAIEGAGFAVEAEARLIDGENVRHVVVARR